MLGLEWSPGQDSFRLTMSDLPSVTILTKRSLTSDIARIFDVLGWFSPTLIQLKILLQPLWETKIDWDDPVPDDIEDTWRSWRAELPMIKNILIPRCYMYVPKCHDAGHLRLHGFCNAPEKTYAEVI